MKTFFNISREENKIVEGIIGRMSLKDKIGQLLFLKQDEEEFSFTPGGVMFRPQPEEKLRGRIRDNNNKMGIKPFISANLESGPRGMISDSIEGVTPLQVAATGDPLNAYRLGEISGGVARGAGANMAFSPIVDININIDNPMVATRGFGSEADEIIEYGKSEFEGFLKNEVIPVVKHFPGDGVSSTDQHLLTAVNDLEPEEWRTTYGRIYRELIASGAEVIMVGHISLPRYVSEFDSSKANYPASLSEVVIKKLLKEELGYEGLIITDSTHMAGYTSFHSRREAIITSLNAGVDMILFSRDPNEDFKYIEEAYRSGEISIESIDEKVRRIISLKVKHNILDREEAASSNRRELAEEGRKTFTKITDASITLFKDEQKLLPLKLEGKKVLVIPITRTKNIRDSEVEYFSELLKKEGAKVTVKNYRDEDSDEGEDLKMSVEEFVNRYDLVIYLVNVKVLSNRTSLRMEYNAFNGVDAPWFVNEVDTMLISLSSPFHDRDAPMIKTVINGYNDTEVTMDKIVEKLRGRSPFKGKDPFRKRRQDV
ncbi:beta-hexosamidase [Propionigenium maris DSM 9537]|uniref:beta-N-acetylhexosaminidase n=1 Tax=Propionigenium maris DSM 9537 TaxID=1123000 RepID=A0A9W6GPA4_9FUSO|nr:glycoside hydrolase family 3 N-terminal domain-containing protein [Propionigenium maris]GLI58162.1 beta-hexosamidase [Propionigenium maris DSM 9537]